MLVCGRANVLAASVRTVPAGRKSGGRLMAWVDTMIAKQVGTRGEQPQYVARHIRSELVDTEDGPFLANLAAGLDANLMIRFGEIMLDREWTYWRKHWVREVEDDGTE